MKKLQKIDDDLFKTLETEEAKKILGGFTNSTGNATVTYHKSTKNYTDDGTDNGDT